MKVTYKMVVDFAYPAKSNTLTISEGDARSRKIWFTLLSNKQPFDMSDVTSVTIRGVTEAGKTIFGDCDITLDEYDNMVNEVSYSLPEALAQEAGKVTMTITVMSDTGEVITSFEFYIIVRNALYSEDDYIAEDDLSGFRDLYNRTLSALKKIEALTGSSALPNPYPLNIDVNGELIAYNGSAMKDIYLGETVHIEDVDGFDADTVEANIVGIARESVVQSTAAADRAMEYSEEAKQTASRFALDLENIKQAIRNLGGVI